nr:hypothetical protein [Pandoravirus massiliensis]
MADTGDRAETGHEDADASLRYARHRATLAATTYPKISALDPSDCPVETCMYRCDDTSCDFSQCRRCVGILFSDFSLSFFLCPFGAHFRLCLLLSVGCVFFFLDLCFGAHRTVCPCARNKQGRQGEKRRSAGTDARWLVVWHSSTVEKSVALRRAGVRSLVDRVVSDVQTHQAEHMASIFDGVDVAAPFGVALRMHRAAGRRPCGRIAVVDLSALPDDPLSA